MESSIAAPVLWGQRSRKRIPPFRLHRPVGIAEAVAIKTSTGARGAYMAGGLDLISRMKDGLAVSDVIHLGALGELAGITFDGSTLSVGARVSHHALAAAPAIRRHAPALAAAWQELGNVRTRIKGTVGGNLMAREPLYDAAPLAMALDATLLFAAADGSRRRVPAATLWHEAPAGEPLLLSIELPIEARVRLLVERSLRPVVSLAVGIDQVGDAVAGVRVAVAGAYPGPRVWPLAAPTSAPALRERAASLAEAFAAGLPEPLDDWRAGAAYRRQMIGVLLRRVLARAGSAA